MKTCRCSAPLRFDALTAELDLTPPAVRVDLDVPAVVIELCLAEVTGGVGQLDWDEASESAWHPFA